MQILERDEQGRPTKGFVNVSWDDSKDPHMQSGRIVWPVVIIATVVTVVAVIAESLMFASLMAS